MYFKNKKKVPEILSNYFKNKTHGMAEILLNYFKNKIHNRLDYFKLLQKLDKGCSKLFKITSKTEKGILEILSNYGLQK